MVPAKKKAGGGGEKITPKSLNSPLQSNREAHGAIFFFHWVELPLSDACGTPAVHYLFSMGYRSHYVQRSRQERTCAGIARSNRVLERGRQIFSAYYAGP